MDKQQTNQKPGKRRAIAVAVAAVIVGGGIFAMTVHPTAGAKDGSGNPVPSITVNVVEPSASTFDRAIGASGSIRATDELIIGSDASGVRLMEVFVDAGSVVQRGQLLAQADDALLHAQLSQQRASFRQAQADHAQARANLDRAERLNGSGVYSEETVQQRINTEASAAAKVDLVRAQMRELEVRISQTRVIAPANGVISKKSATVGTVVQPGTELFRMIRDGQLEWVAEMPGHSIAKVAPGTPARLLLDDGKTLEARVRLVEPTLDTNTRNGLVRVSLPAGSRLKAGEHARGEILLAKAEALSLPESSVMMKDGYAYVYVVGADGVAKQNRIQSGVRRNGLVEISEGLDRHARVIGTGAGFVKDGDLVRIAPNHMRVAQRGDRS
jgi:HlyD family secretion protein